MKPVTFMLCLILGLLHTSLLADGASDLIAYHQTLKDKFDEVLHINADQLASMPAKDILLIDVRENDEYTVSHLQDSIRISPDISARDFTKQFAGRIAGKTIVFYCAVGYRSSALAEDVQESIFNAGASAVYNLEGGIFNWHNQQRPLVSQNGATDAIHPYNKHWGRLLDRPEKFLYQISN